MTPQEKKSLFYKKDRRNVYGENPVAGRRGVRRNKQRRNRTDRHQTAQALADIHLGREDDPDALPVDVTHRSVTWWKKSPDQPIGERILYTTRRWIELTVIRNHVTVPGLVEVILESYRECKVNERAVSAMQQTLQSLLVTGGRVGELDCTLEHAQYLWKVVRKELQRHGIEPMARSSW